MSVLSKKEYRPYYFIAPLLVFICLFILLPIVGTLFTSLMRDVTFLPQKFIFLGNYSDLLRDEGFWRSMRFTLFFIAVAVPLEMLLGTAFAALLDMELPMRGFLRACVLIPWAIPSAISAKIWQLIYNYSYGLANFLITHLGLSQGPVNWLGSEGGAFAAIVIADVWKTAPFVTLLVLAGLQAVPHDLRLQAKIDRANFAQIFFRVTLPLIKPVLLVALLFRTIDSLRIFDVIYVLTNGGPGGSTASASLYAYKYFLGGDFGYGSAVSVLLFAVAFGMSCLYVKVSKFESEI
ncbi:MAG: ABC transporter permease [Elusimicrobia bacterium CG08_land_8_20_14_0_20_51_18]|nr:MAG: ABC transporter permease [Elusimicrobia bacterium CG08_land_8_20_14_0_20_51_18]